jgi:hypothetical protein
MGDRSDRQKERFDVSVEVAFATAQDFVVQYAENLSAGGVFVAGVTDLERLSEHTVRINIPGCGPTEVRARVAHVLTAEVAQQFGRTEGTGLEIIESPPHFQRALMDFLQLLGRRRDHLVLCPEEWLRLEIEKSGYRAEEISIAEASADLVEKAPVFAVIVPELVREDFANSVASVDPQPLVVGFEGNLELVVQTLDAALL